MSSEKYVLPNDIREMAKAYNEVSSDDDFQKLTAIEKEQLSKLDHETLLNMAASMSVLVNAVFLSEPSRERIFNQGFITAKKYHARKANKKSHEETDKMKAEILADYFTNKIKFQSKDDAALSYTKLFPLKFSTIRNYLKNK